MKLLKSIVVILAIVCMHSLSYAQYSPTQSDQSVLSGIKRTVMKVSDKKLETVRDKLEILLPQMKNNAKFFFLLSQFQNIILDEINTRKAIDLAIVNMEVSDHDAESVSFSITLKNNGTIDFQGQRVGVRCSLQGSAEGFWDLQYVFENKTLGAGKTYLAENIKTSEGSQVRKTTGDKVITCTIDPKNNIQEGNEANNSFAHTFNIEKLEQEILDIEPITDTSTSGALSKKEAQEWIRTIDKSNRSTINGK